MFRVMNMASSKEPGMNIATSKVPSMTIGSFKAPGMTIGSSKVPGTNVGSKQKLLGWPLVLRSMHQSTECSRSCTTRLRPRLRRHR